MSPIYTGFLESQTEEVREEFTRDEEAVRTFLLNHVVPGSIMSTDLADGMTINNLAGNELQVVATEDGLTVGGSRLVLNPGR